NGHSRTSTGVRWLPRGNYYAGMLVVPGDCSRSEEAAMAKASTFRFDSDLDAQSPAADLVRVYLNGIGKTALLTAADEVELAKRIEAGLYAEHLLATRKRLGENRKRDLAAISRDGQAARSHLLEANLRLVVSLAKP